MSPKVKGLLSHFWRGGQRVSRVHGLPVWPRKNTPGVVTFVNEIPRGSAVKVEIDPEQAGHALVRDRIVTYAAERGGYPFNYGFIPRTWEDPAFLEHGYGGDGDAVDVVHLGATPLPSGARRDARILGALGMIDKGEMDWKILVVDADDETASLDDAQVDAVRTFFRDYKVPDGSGQNDFVDNGRLFTVDEAVAVVQQGAAAFSNSRPWPEIE